MAASIIRPGASRVSWIPCLCREVDFREPYLPVALLTTRAMAAWATDNAVFVREVDLVEVGHNDWFFLLEPDLKPVWPGFA